MNTYIVAFDNDDLIPWVKIFSCTNINSCKDKIVDYVLDELNIEANPNLEYEDFEDNCASLGLYIGQIKEVDEL